MSVDTHTSMRDGAPLTTVTVDGVPAGFFTERTDTLPHSGTKVRVYVVRMGTPGNGGPAIFIHTRDAAVAWIAREAREEHRI